MGGNNKDKIDISIMILASGSSRHAIPWIDPVLKGPYAHTSTPKFVQKFIYNAEKLGRSRCGCLLKGPWAHITTRKLVKSSHVTHKLGRDIIWVAMTETEKLLALHVIVKNILLLNVTPGLILVKSLYVMLKFGQDIMWKAVTKIE